MSYNPFILRAQKGYVNDPTQHTIAALLGRRTVKEGDVGLEIEVEGNKFPKSSEYADELDESKLIPKQWFYTHDGSLRGKDNAEYVLREPLKFSEVHKALDDLWQMFKDYGSVLDESHRTSVHVHLNVQGWHINRLAAFAGLYFSVEEILTEWCGDTRVGNLFCLRAKDAPAIIGKLRQFINYGDFSVFDDGLHYAAFNAHSMTDKGSIEIRTMRGVNDPEIIKIWVEVLQHIYELSGAYPDPRGVCEGFSGFGHESYLKQVIGPHWERIIVESKMNENEVREAMYRGIRIAQNICYCRDWTKFKTLEVKPDPFGRPLKQLQGYSPEPISLNPSTMNASVPGSSWLTQAVAHFNLLNTVPPAPPEVELTIPDFEEWIEPDYE